MRLSANLVVNYANVNQFSFTQQWKIRAGDPNTLYFQLVDLDQSGCNKQCPQPLRYLAGICATNLPYGVTVTCPSIDNSKVLEFTATQVDPNDSSLWSISILPTQIPSSGNVLFQLQECGTIRNFSVQNAMAVELPGADGMC